VTLSIPLELLIIALLCLNCDDVQGGYPNGKANGLKHPLLTNGRIPNGQVSRDRCSVRIIENPQVMSSCCGGACNVMVTVLLVGRDLVVITDATGLMVL
jgi:hypothetical protein